MPNLLSLSMIKKLLPMIITIINGPNLNLLGNREKDIYGEVAFEDYLEELRHRYNTIDFRYFQSNIEGELVNALQESAESSDGLILNAAGYTHTSVSIADAVANIDIPVIEVHISNILAREEYRHISFVAPHCNGSLFFFVIDGYRLATDSLIDLLTGY